MRDPSGRVDLSGDRVTRVLYDGLPAGHFLESPIAKDLLKSAALVPYEISADRRTIYASKVPFVTYPYEWCNEQLRDAADLTLTISEAVLDAGFELKDASAWNIIFDGVRPIFCDHLSFEQIRGRQWWAFAQFVRHFVLPLTLARFRKLGARESFKLNRDGLTPEQAKDLMGLRRFATRFWPLMLTGKAGAGSKLDKKTPVSAEGSFHRNLYALLRWFLKGASAKDAKSTWGDYTQERAHYTDAASDFKRKLVGHWLVQCAPEWVIDFGCNTGEFSNLALEAGARVIAIDLDHEAIQKLYRQLKVKGVPVYPVVANLDDLSGGRGWAGREFPGLVMRLTGSSDVAMMLALVHHLAISASVPYSEIAKLAAQMTKKYVIVELLDASDPLVVLLAQQRDRSPAEFGIEKQKEAFLSLFEMIDEQPVPGSQRVLCLMKKRDA